MKLISKSRVQRYAHQANWEIPISSDVSWTQFSSPISICSAQPPVYSVPLPTPHFLLPVDRMYKTVNRIFLCQRATGVPAPAAQITVDPGFKTLHLRESCVPLLFHPLVSQGFRWGLSLIFKGQQIKLVNENVFSWIHHFAQADVVQAFYFDSAFPEPHDEDHPLK